MYCEWIDKCEVLNIEQRLGVAAVAEKQQGLGLVQRANEDSEEEEELIERSPVRPAPSKHA